MVLKDPRCEYGYAMFLYDDGESEPEGVIEKDNKLANKLFAEAYPKLKKLAEEGDMYSHFILGAYHNYGIGGVKRDFSQAIQYIEKSAELGHYGACFDMGKFYLEGKGVEKNNEKAREYFEKAQKGGSVRAKEMLKELQ